MVRERLEFTPQWEGPIEGFTVNFCTANQWRVTPEFQFDDLYQDAFLLFVKMSECYPEVVEAQHFMALFKRALFNHVTNLASRRTRRQRHEAIAVLGREPRASARNAGTGVSELLADADVRLMLMDAPEVVRKLAALVESEDLPEYERINGERESTSQWLARVTGIPFSKDLALKVRAWLEGVDLPGYRRDNGVRESTTEWLTRVSSLMAQGST